MVYAVYRMRIVMLMSGLVRTDDDCHHDDIIALDTSFQAWNSAAKFCMSKMENRSEVVPLMTPQFHDPN